MSAHRFQAVLLSRGTESTFQIVETNDFKQLAHISLAFKPGCNATVKNVSWTAWMLTTLWKHVVHCIGESGQLFLVPISPMQKCANPFDNIFF